MEAESSLYTQNSFSIGHDFDFDFDSGADFAPEKILALTNSAGVEVLTGMLEISEPEPYGLLNPETLHPTSIDKAKIRQLTLRLYGYGLTTVQAIVLSTHLEYRLNEVLSSCSEHITLVIMPQYWDTHQSRHMLARIWRKISDDGVDFKGHIQWLQYSKTKGGATDECYLDEEHQEMLRGWTGEACCEYLIICADALLDDPSKVTFTME